MEEQAKISAAEKKKLIKRRRVVRYFIDAAVQIVQDEGIDALTIRKVADAAGYNSATLYNYFENLDQLIAFTCIDVTQEWRMALAEIYSSGRNVLYQYLEGWRQFCEKSWMNTDCYSYIYIEHTDAVIQQFRAYDELFCQEEGKEIPVFSDIYRQKTLLAQEQATIATVIAAGYIDEQDAESIYNIALLLFEGLVSRTKRVKRAGGQIKNYTDEFMFYFVGFVRSKLKEEIDLSEYLS